jgi:gliding motility-associated-like protein
MKRKINIQKLLVINSKIKTYMRFSNLILLLLISKLTFALNYTTVTAHVSCNGGSDGSILVRLTEPGVTPYTYQLWSDLPPFLSGSGSLIQQIVHNADTALFSGLTARSTYYLWVYDDIGDNKGQFNPVNQPTLMANATITVVKGLSCFDASDAQLRVNMSGGTPPYDYIWSPNTGSQTTQIALNLGTGIYSVTVDDANNCGGAGQIATIFFVPPHDSIPPQINITSIDTTPTCQGTSNGTIQINASGGTPDLDYAIVNIATTDSAFQEGSLFTALEAGTYRTWVIDNKGCTKQGSNAVVRAAPLPVANAGSDIITCTGTAAIAMTGATATGTYSGIPAWSGGGGLGTWTQNADPALATFTPTAASGSFTATLTLTGALGCSDDSDTRQITWGTQPVANAGSDIVTCTGTAAIAMAGATATGTYSGIPAWSGGGGLGTWTQNADPALATYTPTAASGSFTATLTLTGANGCTDDTDTRLITWGTQPVANAGSDIVTCTGTAPIAMTGATATGTYSGLPAWSGGSGLGTWTQNADPALATFTPTAASGSFIATLTLTGANGCSNATDTRQITWGTQPAANAGSDISTCTGTTVIAMTGATASGTYSGNPTWSGGGGLGTWTQNANPALATFNPTTVSGSFIATLTLTGANGCSDDTDTRVITWHDPPSASAGSDIVTCTGTAAILMTGATASGNYSGNPTWSGGGGLGTWTQNADPALATFTPAAASGSFTATLTLTGADGCPDDADTRQITWGTQPVADAGSDIASCSGTAPIAMTGATASGTYSGTPTWSGGGGLGTWTQNADPALATFTPTTASGSFSATLTLTGANGCPDDSDTRQITWGTQPVAGAGSDIVTCTGTAPIAMTGATASGTYSGTPTWSGGGGLGTWTQNADPALAIFTPTAASGSFTATLTLTGANGCSDATDTRQITWGTQPVADAGSDIVTCTGTAPIAMTGATASGTYSGTPTWSGGGGLGTWTQNADPALATFTPTAASGSFTATLTLTGANGCSDATDTRQITWGTQPVADAGPDISTCTATAAIPMTGATASGTYSGTPAWSGGSGLGTWTQNSDPALATFTPSTPSGSFIATLTLTGANGCSDATDTRVVTWYEPPAADAGSDISTCTGTAAIIMTGATASGNYSGNPVWSGGGGLGTWTQNADPALATFTPSTPSGSFTATLTLTGAGGCPDDTDTRIITWYDPPAADAGSNIITCTGTSAIPMTGATASGNYSGNPTWSGGAGLGTWTQNADPALATFTPATPSGSFTATLTLTGANGCPDDTDTRLVTWSTPPVADAGSDIITCTGTAAILMTGATASGNYSGNPVWSGGGGLGTWTQNADPALATFTPTTPSGSFTATLTLTGAGGCPDDSDTRLITWGTQPVADAGSDIITCTGMAAIPMLGATASGTYSGNPTWSGGDALGTWTQNADPALATFTPTAPSGSFTAILTLTGANGCSDDSDTRQISWGTQPVANAGSDISSCTATAPIPMTGATASGTYSGIPTWTGGSGSGTWTQNSDPAMATFTPSAQTGSFTATLTLTGINGCIDATDTRIISWSTPPAAEAGPDASICYDSSYTISGADTINSSGLIWTSSGDGSFDDDEILEPEYTPGVIDRSNGSVTLYLEAFGYGSCSSEIDSMILTIPPQLQAAIGAPAPFLIGQYTEIEVCLSTNDHQVIQDLGYYLVAPDGTTTMPLKRAPMEYDFFGFCNFGSDVNNLCFTTELPIEDTLDVCSEPTPLSGDFAATGDWSILYGMNPAEGGWAVQVKDTANNRGGIDGSIIHASISFTDTAYTGQVRNIMFDSDVIDIPILEPAKTSYIIPLGLRTSCYGECDAEAIVNVVGGTPPYINYNWAPAPYAGNGKDTVFLCEGNYSVTVTDAMGCQAIATVEVTSPPEIILSSVISTDSISCHGDNDGIIAAKASGGTGTLTYTLQPGNIPSMLADSGRWENLSGGTYTIHIEDASGCSPNDTSVFIFEPDALALDSLVVDSITCSGFSDGSITVAATGGNPQYTYWITPGTEVNNDGLFENLSEGIYGIRFTDSKSCDTIIIDNINIASPLILNIDTVYKTDIVCNGGTGGLSIQVSGGSSPFESSLNGAPYSPTLDYIGLSPDSYNVSVRDGNGCETTYSGNPVILINPPPISIDSLSVTDVTGCFGDATGSIYIEASGGWNNFTYALSDSVYQPGNFFGNLTGGSDTIYIRDSLGCILVLDTITIDQPSQIVFITFESTPVVGDTLGTITLEASGGTPGYTYSIILDGDTTANKTGFFDSLDVGTYEVMAMDTVGCFITDVIEVTEKELSVIINNIENVSCNGFNDGGFIYLIDQTGTNPPFTVTLITSTDTTTYMLNNYTYSYSNALPADTYTLHIEDPAGTEFDTTITITEPPPIVALSNVTDASCAKYILDGSIELWVSGGTGGFSYQWYRNSIPVSTDTSLYDIGYGYYEVLITDNSLCQVTRGFNVLALDSVDADAGEDGAVCPGETYQLNGLSERGINYFWSPGELLDDSAILNPVAYVESTTSFTLTAYRGVCWETDNIVVTVYPADSIEIYDPSGKLDLDTALYLVEGETYLIAATPGFSSYLWTPSDGLSDINTQATYITPQFVVQEYIVYGTNMYGCISSDTLNVYMAREIDIIYSGFTPNEDGYNDTWHIPYAADYGDKLEVEIFNRWGERVFHSRGYGADQEWDGKFKGKDLPIGTYYYIIKIHDTSYEPITGAVTIIR